jgi:hypothetical protein
MACLAEGTLFVTGNVGKRIKRNQNLTLCVFCESRSVYKQKFGMNRPDCSRGKAIECRLNLNLTVGRGMGSMADGAALEIAKVWLAANPVNVHRT